MASKFVIKFSENVHFFLLRKTDEVEEWTRNINNAKVFIDEVPEMHLTDLAKDAVILRLA